MQILVQSLQAALRPLATVEFIDELVLGLQVLSEHLYTDHELELINALDGNTDELAVVQQAHDCIYNHLHSVCALHRLKASAELRVAELAKLVRALLLMQHWEDGAAIVALCESDAPEEERLACLVALVGELTEVQANDAIEEIDVNFLRGLKNLYTADVLGVYDESDLQTPAQQLEKLRAWRRLMGAERALAYRMIKTGYRPGAGLEQYLSRVGRTLAERENKEIAAEVIPFLLMARDGWENPLQAWRRTSAMLDLEPKDITAVDVEVLKLLGEFDRLKTQEVNP